VIPLLAHEQAGPDCKNQRSVFLQKWLVGIFFPERITKIMAQNSNNQSSGKIKLLFREAPVLFAFTLIAFCYLIGCVLLDVFVVSKFSALFDDLNVSLPLPTRILLPPYGVAVTILGAGSPFLYLLLLLIKRPKWSTGIRITLVIIILAQVLFFSFFSIGLVLPIFQASSAIGGG